MNMYLNQKQVADRLGVTVQTVWRWKKDGVITFHRIGRKLFISEEELEAWLKEDYPKQEQ